MSATLRQRGRGGPDESSRPKSRSRVTPEQVHETIARHLLLDGFPMVLDTAASHGSWIVDALDGREYLDLYTFYASAPLGLNPPGLVEDGEFMEQLAEVAANKPANSDFQTTQLASFVETFSRVLGDPALPNVFFIEGGALAVENALKVAFDWKSRRNEAAGRSPDLGTQVMHLRYAFHGRSGYTLSLTNTDPVKVDRFPKFAWPRVSSPAVTFPLEANLAELERLEAAALDEATRAFEENPHDIACFLTEPIQAEGGDRHLRAEFLQSMQALCRQHEALFVLDEVQTGCGATGTPWCYQQLGLEPDVVAFAKKLQVGGIMAGRRVDEEPANVFRVPSRLGSTWSGNLTDMVRSRRLLQLIESTGAIANAAEVGSYVLGRLTELSAEMPSLVSNARGRGVLAAIDLPDTATRDAVLTALRTDEGVIALQCGDRTLRLRPALSITLGEAEHGLDALGRVLRKAEA